MSKMRLRCEEEFKRDIGWSGRIRHKCVRLVMRPNSGTKVSEELLYAISVSGDVSGAMFITYSVA